jgi:DNA-binding transcriptional LysR family regulator
MAAAPAPPTVDVHAHLLIPAVEQAVAEHPGLRAHQEAERRRTGAGADPAAARAWLAPRLGSLDLNLLVALNALLEERNVTRAGLRLGLSQPSTSALLARLRRHFGDELLARVGNSYELTPLAVTLRERSAAAIDVVERTFAAQSSFDPATTDQTFSLVVSDYAIMVFGDPLLRLIRARAPGAQLHLQELGIATRAPDFDAMLRTVDGAVFPHGYVSGYPSANLYRDEWVVIAAVDNAAICAEPTLQELATAPWLVTRHRPAAFSAPFHRLSAFGVEPRIDGAVDNFQSLPMLVSGSDRVAAVPRRLAERLAGAVGVRALPLPIDTGPIVETLWWHPAHTRDPAHVWLRGVVGDACAHLAA